MIKSKTSLTLLLIIIFHFGTSNRIKSQTITQLSRSYIDAYFGNTPEVYSGFLDDNVIWADPTWSEIDPKNTPISGKKAMIDHLKEATSGISNMEYLIDYHFISGKIAVFEGTLKYSWQNTVSDKIFYFEIREVSILEFNSDNKIIKHTDYSDFRNWMRQYQNQL